MRAIVIDRFGGPEVLRAAQVEPPRPGPGEVLVRVVAAGVSRADLAVREGCVPPGCETRLPLVPGWQGAGSVEDPGTGSSGRYRKGDRVWVCARRPLVHRGTYAELVAVPETALSPMPAKLLFEEAAVVPLAGLAAYQALFDGGGALAGDPVLVLGGAGGVGHLALQMARQAGATVLATARPEAFGFVLERGASGVIDARREPVGEAARRLAPDGVGLVLDAVGGEVAAQALAAVRPGGRLVSLAPDAPQPAAGVTVDELLVEPDATILRRLAEWVDARTLRPEVQRIFPLAQATEAHRALEAGGVRGALVLNL